MTTYPALVELCELIQVRLTREFKERLEVAAKELGVAKSDLVREGTDALLRHHNY